MSLIQAQNKTALPNDIEECRQGYKSSSHTTNSPFGQL